MVILLCRLGRLLLDVRHSLILLLIPSVGFSLEYSYTGPYQASGNVSYHSCTSTSQSKGSCDLGNNSAYIEIGYFVGDSFQINGYDRWKHYGSYCPPRVNPNGTYNPDGPYFLIGTSRTNSNSSGAGTCYYGDPPDQCPADDVTLEYGCAGGLVTGTEGNYPLCSSSQGIPDVICKNECVYKNPQQIIGSGGQPYPGTTYIPDSRWAYTSDGSTCTDQNIPADKVINDGFESGDSSGLDGHDGDGDGTPDADDPEPDNPDIGGDSDGDGTPDSEDPEPGNPDVGGSGNEGSGFGEGSGGSFSGGTCTPSRREAPSCKPHLDVINCGIYIEQWNTRCDAKLFQQEIIGTDQYRAGPDLDDAEQEGIPSATFNASSVISGLSETTIQFGGGQCPADQNLSVPTFNGTFALSYGPICDFAVMVRPVVIALGYVLSALIILRKFSGSED